MSKTKLLFYGFLFIEGVFFVILSYCLGSYIDFFINRDNFIKEGAIWYKIYLIGSTVFYFLMFVLILCFGKKIKKRVRNFEQEYYSKNLKKNLYFGKNLIKFHLFLLTFLAPLVFVLYIGTIFDLNLEILNLLDKFEDKDEII